MTQRDPADAGWNTEPVHFNLVDGPPRYKENTDSPVNFVPVADDEHILGYLWFVDDEGAAGFIPCVAAGRKARNAKVTWVQELQATKGKGLSPSEAVAQLAVEAGNAQVGRLVLGQSSSATQLQALRALASDEGRGQEAPQV
jgi:hypothetical protein